MSTLALVGQRARRAGRAVPVGDWSERRCAAADRGAGSVLVIAVTAVVIVLAGAVALLGQVEVARARAQAGADLAALVGAAAMRQTNEVEGACGLARQVAERNGATIASCTHLGGGVLAVTVRIAAPIGAATATAKAGPTSARSP